MKKLQKLKMVVKETSASYSENNLYWEKGGKLVGMGFKSKDSDHVGLTKCPACNRENYAMNVMSGMCTWRGWAIDTHSYS